MGSELWTSSVTGYRRRGTRFAELRKHFEDSITASAILEPLRSAPSTAEAAEIARVLVVRDFDVAGVQDTPHVAARSYIVRADLNRGGQVVDYARDITTDMLIADSTPLAEILRVLSTAQFRFVMIGPDVRGIVTQADLNKPPVRIYLFGILSLIEMHVTFWIRSEIPEAEWTLLLPNARVRAARSHQRQRKAKGQDIDLLDCLSFGDKKLILQGDTRVPPRLGLEAGEIPRLKVAHDLRNQLAHAHSNLAQDWTWPEIADIVSLVERIVVFSDREIEAEAATRAAAYEDTLWASA